MATVIFDGVGNMPELNRLTAKKNYASSSQSHKMGATAAFNDILHYLAEEKYPDLKNEVGGRVAVYQHPVYGFQKKLVEGTKDQYIHDFIGLYTVGADKGDKGYFGFSDSSVKKTAIRLEGTDHLKGVGFNYPWEVNGVKTIRYNADKEALCVVTGNDKTKWTAILEQSAIGSAETESEIEAYLEQEFRPAYECAYNNNPLIVGTTMSISEINANVDAFGKLRRYDDRPYSYCEFWIDGEYDLYYLNQERGVYEKNGVNLLTQLGISASSLSGKTLEEKNKIFINARVEAFRNQAENYWHKNDALLQLTFLYIIAASDNGEKNMYPYKMKPLAEGSRWRFLQDDLDSIFSTDNQGQDTKPYSVELHDFTDENKQAYVFKGEDSALWQLVELAWPAEMRQMGYDVMQAMYDLSTKGTKTTDKLMGFFDGYFFDRAQEYFTKSAYNNDTEFSYEEAWNNKEYVASVDIHPLAQALGGHLSAERAWVQKRIVYLMSKYGFGGYSSYEDTALGVISVRTQVAQGFTLTPAIDSYPTILGGQAQVSSATERVLAGTPIQLSAVGGGNTNTYIVGADFLSDIGDLKDLSIDPSSVVTLSVASKRLRRLKVGDENPEEVTSYLATLAIQRCDSLEQIDARNLTTLVGTVDLSQCPRLREALFGGTNATAVIIAAGSKIEKVQLPDSITAIDLRDNKFLEEFDYGTLANLRFLRLEGVPVVNGFAMLKEAYNAEGQQLKDIRLVGFEYDGDATDVDLLANLADDKDKYGNEHFYNGIDAQGNPTEGNPVIEGKLNIDGYVYEDTANVVRQNFPTIEFTPKGYYIRFADPEVLRVLLSKNIGDGTGITTEVAESYTGNMAAFFQNNKVITRFDELEKFTSMTTIGVNFAYGATELEIIKFPPNITEIVDDSFRGTSKLAIDVSLPNLKKSGGRAFSGSGITKISNLGSLTAIPGGMCSSCKQLTSVTLPKSCVELGTYAFSVTTALTSINLDNIETFSNSCFESSGVGGDLNLPKAKSFGTRAFFETKITSVSNLGTEITQIPDYLFNNCANLTSVDLSRNAITSVGAYAFTACKLLSTLNMDFSYVKSIGNSAFYACSVLKIDVSCPMLETIGTSAFYDCAAIERVLDLGKVEVMASTSIYGQFASCKSLKFVELPETLTQMGSNIFRLASKLETVKINAITPPTIVSDTFAATPATMSIYVPNESLEAYRTADNWSALATKIWPMEAYLIGIIKFADPVVASICAANFDKNGTGYVNFDEAKAVTSIGTFFRKNTEITSFDEFEHFTSVKSLDASAFDSASNLSSIKLPNSIETIGNTAFWGCSSLTSALQMENVKTIGINSFYNAPITGDIYLPRLTMIGDGAFRNTAIQSVSNLGSITVLNNYVFADCKNLTRVVIPDSVVELKEYIFQNNSSLESVVIPTGITTIGRACFLSCTSLSIDVNLPNLTSMRAYVWQKTNIHRVVSLGSIQKIEDSMFYGCKNLIEVNIPDTCVELGNSTFRDCESLKVFNMKNIKTTGNNTLAGCKSLESIIVPSVQPPTIGNSEFEFTNSTFKIYVPDGSVDTYKTATNWSAFASRIKPLSEYQE